MPVALYNEDQGFLISPQTDFLTEHIFVVMHHAKKLGQKITSRSGNTSSLPTEAPLFQISLADHGPWPSVGPLSLKHLNTGGFLIASLIFWKASFHSPLDDRLAMSVN